MSIATTIVGIDGPLTLFNSEANLPLARIICLHGWTLDHRSFDRQLPLIDHGLCITRYDRRGFGLNPQNPCTAGDLADLDQIVMASDLPVILYGVSQGARLALRYALSHGDKLTGLVFQGGLVDCYPYDPRAQDEPPLRHYESLLNDSGLTTMKSEWLKHPLMSSGVLPKDLPALADLVQNYSGLDLKGSASSTVNQNNLADEVKLTCPLLVTVAAMDSEQRQEHAKRLASENEGTRILQTDGGHLCNFSHAEEFNSQLLEWIGHLGLSQTA